MANISTIFNFKANNNIFITKLWRQWKSTDQTQKASDRRCRISAWSRRRRILAAWISETKIALSGPLRKTSSTPIFWFKTWRSSIPTNWGRRTRSSRFCQAQSSVGPPVRSRVTIKRWWNDIRTLRTLSSLWSVNSSNLPLPPPRLSKISNHSKLSSQPRTIRRLSRIFRGSELKPGFKIKTIALYGWRL